MLLPTHDDATTSKYDVTPLRVPFIFKQSYPRQKLKKNQTAVERC